MTVCEDPRYDRTECDLKDAFQILAGKKELDKITVSEITRLTGVTRSTFYNHYEDMPSFIDAMENMIVEEIFGMMIDFEPKGSSEITRKFFDTLCTYIGKNEFLIHILSSPQAYVFVEKALTMFHEYVGSVVEKSGKTGVEQEAYSYALAYSIGGVVGVLHKWASQECRESAEVTAFYLTSLFMDGMHSWL